MSEPRASKYQIRLPLVLFLGIAAGVFIGASLRTPQSSGNVGKDVQKFREVLTYLQEEYVDDVKTEELVGEAIEKMLSKLDPHSVYIPARDTTQANESLRGGFDGIGIEFNIFQDTIFVVTPLSGGPSEALGIQSGDRIIQVDGENVASVGITSADVMRLLKGPRGSKVQVTILRKDEREPIEYTIIRDKIPQFSVDVSYMVNNEIGYIKINQFTSTTYQEFKQALSKLRERGLKKLILDLQGNPGGYMNMAIDMADDFLGDGKKIVFTKGKDSKFDQEAFATSKGDFETGDLIVLVNEASASASEIVAGALQDNDRALVVGRRSFGKGLVQTTFELNDGAELRLTISRYYTPSGRSIQKPYDNIEDYDQDIITRYQHGEFFHADSIKFNDTLKYKTQNGRTVYGGGGIMPDYFVPLDTTQTSAYLNELYASTSIQEYVFGYSEKNKSRLEKMGLENFRKTFTVSDEMLDQLVSIGQRNRIKPDRLDLKTKRELIKLNVKAQIGRRVWGNEGFYPILNENNNIFQQAIKLFDRIPELNRQSF
ncbi:MAG: S41 family peptidase [Flammeovirgaceae bacterium]|nr:S41 family peptidase [Flammeovirgaceae bacterium]